MATAAPIGQAFKVLVTFESRGDGGLRAYSDDVPGFVLSNQSCDVVLSGVEPTLETILSAMVGAPIRVSSLYELHELRDGLREAGIIWDSHTKQREYVGIPAHA